MLATVIMLSMQGVPSGRPFLRTPDIHGNQIAFACEGDIWVSDLITGRAERLTTDAGVEESPVFSPDGTMIAFHGEYDGLRGAYVMPTTGGPPRRLTYAMDFRTVTGWTPDGSAVVYRKFGVPTSYEYWTAPVNSGVYKRLPLEFASHVWFGPDEDTYCFTRFSRWYTAWFHYIGGLQNQIWIHRNGKFEQLTTLEGTNEYPVWCGDRIYFANEKNAKFTLMSVSASGGKPKVEAGPYPYEVRELSTDGHKVIYEKGDTVELFDPAKSEVSEVTADLHSDLIHTRPYQVPAQEFSESASLTPGAKRVLVGSRGQIVSLPVGEGEARIWKSEPGARLGIPAMSPDAKKVAYVSDKSGEQQIVVADASGDNEKSLTVGKRQIKSMTWSPDSKWIVYYDSRMMLRLLNVETSEDSEIAHFSATWYGSKPDFSPDSKWVVYTNTLEHTSVNAIYLYDVTNKKSIQVSDGKADDTAASFSADGKWLVFISSRNLKVDNDPVLNQLNLNPVGVPCLLALADATKSPFLIKDPEEGEAPAEKPKDGDKEPVATKIDLDGLYARRVEVPVTPAAYVQTAMVKDRIVLGTADQITFYDIATKKGGALTSGSGFELSKDGGKLLTGTPKAPRVVDTTGTDVAATVGAVSYGQLKLRIEPVTEWKQMFWDAWRLLRDYFYLANMHGNDWDAIGAKYSAMLPSVRSREELDELIRWMQSELGSSHEYLEPGDVQSIKPRVVPAYLGIDLAMADNHLKISHIVQGDGFRSAERSPLADPMLGVREGMYLLKVGGAPVSSSVEVYDRLLGRAGQVVSVTVSDTTAEKGSKTVYIKPVANERRMRYLDWVEKNRLYVEKASGGKVGYLHLAAMSDQDMQDFVKQYFPQRNKEALIVDDRFNNGGYIQTFVNNVLGAKVSGYFNMRESREPWSRQGDAFIGPMCCLINEFCISCGEEFPHRFKDLGIGPLIGRRTEGGEVGSSPGWPLMDGGVVNVPNYGMFTPAKGWVIEGAGVSPDIDVPSDPNAWIQGRDPQLDAAVKEMLDALKKKPVVWPKEPAPRDRVHKG